MTDILIRVMALPKIAQRSLAIALAGIGLLIILLLVLTSFQMLVDLQSRIEEGRYNLARFDRLLDQKPAGEAQVEASIGGTVSAFLEGDNIAVIQAGLQTRMNTIAGSQSVVVASVGNTPPLMIDGIQYVGVRANVQGKLPAINNTLFQLETSLPPLIIKEASVRSTNSVQLDSLTGPIELAVEIAVYGAVNPKSFQTGAEGTRP